MKIYNFIFCILFPFILLRGLYKSFKYGEKLSRNFEKLSIFKVEKNSKKIIFIHAVSVGEVLASRKFVEEVKKRFPNHQILITCTTQTGSATIRRIYGNSVLHQYLPYDLKFFIKRFLKLWKPEITFIIETEIWPNLIDQLSKQKRKVFLVNGRLSEKSFRRYKSFLPILDNVFEKIDFTVCQGSEDLERFVELGIQENKIKKDFSFKFDTISIKEEKNIDFINSKGDKKVIICASTHNPEEKILVDAFKKLNDEKVLLILVPRHPERAIKIQKEMIKSKIEPSLFSKNQHRIDFSKKIILVDEIGYLENLFSLADIAFIGGSLIDHGGQNFLEAVKFSLPISSGKSYFNFQEIAEDLIKLNILFTADTPEELCNIWKKQINLSSNEIARKASDYLAHKQGASIRTLECLPL
tara:strand:+ start:14948 stop:16183 length:1236 start_codon:yes stop_codon:yes gene_type:complete